MLKFTIRLQWTIVVGLFPIWILNIHQKQQNFLTKSMPSYLLQSGSNFYTYLLPKLGEKMKQKVVVDGRKVLNAQELVALGFRYVGVGAK